MYLQDDRARVIVGKNDFLKNYIFSKIASTVNWSTNLFVTHLMLIMKTIQQFTIVKPKYNL